MKCELCKNEHDGKYGSGRFCCIKCARAFSTSLKREEINKKVSETFKQKGSTQTSHLHTPEIVEKRKQTMLERYGVLWFTDEQRANARKKARQTIKNKFKNIPFDELSIHTKRRRLIEECNNICSCCKNSLWLGKPIKLELDHVDGNHKNNSKENLRMLCPNCHSMTDTWKGKNKQSFRNKNNIGSVAQPVSADPS